MSWAFTRICIHRPSLCLSYLLFSIRSVCHWILIVFLLYGIATHSVSPSLTHFVGEFPSYWGWLWCPGLSPVLASIALPFAFQTCCFPFALSAIGFQSCFFFTVSPPTRSTLHLLPFLDEFLGLGLNLIPDVVVPEADQLYTWSRKLDPNFCPGRGIPQAFASNARACKMLSTRAFEFSRLQCECLLNRSSRRLAHTIDITHKVYLTPMVNIK